MIRPKSVKTKQDFYERFYRGEFGNHGLMWSSLQKWKDSQYKKPIAIRTLKPGGRCDYDIPCNEVEQRTEEFHKQGWLELNWSAMAPTERIIIQGEGVLSVGGLQLFISKEKFPMREALRIGGFHTSGVLAMSHLRITCDPDSFDWLMYLFEAYDEHVVEFSIFECCWGVVANKNTVIWEVRKY